MFEDRNHSPNHSNGPKYHRERRLGGEVISEESFQSFAKIILEEANAPIEGLIEQIKELIPSLPQKTDMIRVIKLLNDSIDVFNTLNELRSQSAPDTQIEQKYDIYLKFSSGIHKVMDTLERIYTKEIYDCDEDEIDEDNPNIKNLLITRVVKHHIDLYFSEEDESHFTNILGAILSTSQQEGAQYAPNDFYTTISPHVIRSMILAVIKQKQDFFNELVIDFSSHYSVSDVLSALLDNNFEDTGLANIISPPVLRIDQEDYNININWEIPAALSFLVKKNFGFFTESLDPLKKILKEIGGNLEVAYDEYKISVIITCPIQDSPDYDPLNELISDDDVQACCVGKAPLFPVTMLPCLELKRDYDDKEPDSRLKLYAHPCCFTMEGRAILALALSLAAQVDENKSIEEMVVHVDDNLGLLVSYEYRAKYINGTEGGGNASLAINATALNKENISFINYIAQAAKCEKLELIGDPGDVNIQLSQIYNAFYKALSFCTGPYSIKYQRLEENDIPQLEIRDRDNNLVVMARYDEKSQTLAGRFHDPKLTYKVSDIVDEVFREDTLTTRKPYLNIDDPFFLDALMARFAKHNVFLTDRFKSLIHAVVVSENCGSLPALTANLKMILFNGIMSIDQKKKKIFLDVPEINKDGRDDYYRNNVIELK